MPYRTWLLVFALALVLVSGLGQAQEQTEDPQGQPNQQQEPSQSFPLPFPVVVVEDDAAAEARQRHEGETRQREIEDLVAQQEMNAATQAMNDATQRMTEYAFWSTVFVAVGTVLLVGTLLLTWQANSAAVESVAHTRRIGQSQVRAYIEFLPQNINLISPSGNSALKITGQLSVVGGSPARNLSAGLWVGGSNHKAEKLPIGITMTTFRSYAAPATNIPVFSVQAPLGNFGFDLHTAKEVWCCVFVEWVDVFDESHIAKFQFALVNKGDGTRISGGNIESAFRANAVAAISA